MKESRNYQEWKLFYISFLHGKDNSLSLSAFHWHAQNPPMASGVHRSNSISTGPLDSAIVGQIKSNPQSLNCFERDWSGGTVLITGLIHW